MKFIFKSKSTVSGPCGSADLKSQSVDKGVRDGEDRTGICASLST